jgi:hypothetical protein
MMSFIFRRNRLVVLVPCLFFSAVAHPLAQDVRVETQQQARAREQNTLDQQAAPEEVTDPELGDINLVSRAPRPKMFAFSTVQTLNYSSNAFLVRDGTESDFFWNGRVGASFVPYATRNFTPRLTFNQDWFRYNRFSDLDFDAQTLQLDLKYDLNRDDTWYVNGSYAVARLYSPDASTGEFYRYGYLNGSITHLVQLRTAPINLWVTGGAYWRHGDPSLSDRVSGYLNVAATYSIRETIQLSGFTRPEVQHYTHDESGSSREDFNLTVGATLSWTPNQYVAFAATASYIGNFSTVSERRYDLVTPSLIVAAQIAF